MNEMAVYSATTGTDATEAVVLTIVVVLYILFIALWFAQYIMSALSLFTIAKRRNVPNPILAWIPVADMYLIGQIADEYDSHTTGRKNWGKIMLTLMIVGMGMIFVFYIGFVVVMVVGAMAGAETTDMTFLISFITMYAFILLAALIINMATLMKNICTYKVYESTVPEKAVLYTILSAMVPLAGGICLMKVKDKGYPEVCNTELIEEIREEFTK